MRVKTRGLVIKEQNIKENDRYITILTGTDGIIRATAYGSGKTTSPISAQTRIFACADFNLSETKGFYKVDSADTVETFFELSKSMENVAAASYFCELLNDVGLAGVADESTLRLALNTLYALCRLNKPHKLVKAIFELRLMMISGYEPNLTCCQKCGNEVEDVSFFSAADGCIYCKECNTEKTIKLSDSALEAMRYIAAAPIGRLFSFDITGESAQMLYDACEKYALTQMDKSYKALDIYKSISAFTISG